jgi:hypothetical protein
MSRGPLGRAKPSQIAAIRTLVTAYTQWERAQGTPAQTLSPVIPSGARSGLPFGIENDIAARARRRINARTDAAEIAATHRILYLREYRPDQWREEQTTQHLAGIHRELTLIRQALEQGVPAD